MLVGIRLAVAMELSTSGAVHEAKGHAPQPDLALGEHPHRCQGSQGQTPPQVAVAQQQPL